MIFSFRKRERRRELLAGPFPEEWHAYLRENVLLYRVLSEVEQAKLRDALRIFIAEKFWEGCQGLTITDEIKVTIASQACLLVLGFDDYYFDEVQSILVYPGGYLVSDPSGEDDEVGHLVGSAHHKGPVVLSWWDSSWSGRRWTDRNVVLHEFAHKLAELNDSETGTPPMADPCLEDRWQEVMAAEYDRLVEDAVYERASLLDPYGAISRAEFFAVATECFFLQPVQLRRQHPDLYQLLAVWYRQDPARRPPLAAHDRAECERAESEYAQHAIAESSVAIRLHPNQAENYQDRADLYCEQGEYDRAIRDYTALIQLDPENAGAFRGRGDAYRSQGRYDLALADFNQAIRLCPSHTHAYSGRAAVYSDKGDFEKALADLAQAIRLDPKDDVAYIRRGLIYFEQKEYDKAIPVFSNAIRLFPRSADLYRARAEAYKALGQAEKAQQDQAEADQLERETPS